MNCMCLTIKSIVFYNEKLFGLRPLGECVLESINTQCGSPSILASPNTAGIPFAHSHFIELVYSTMEALGLPSINKLLLSCRNSSRNSRNLVKVVGMYETLQHDAEQIDLDVSKGKFYISSWLYKAKLDMIFNWLEAGFGLSVYEVYEWEMVCYHLIYVGDMQLQHFRLIEAQREGGLILTQKREIKVLGIRREMRRALMLVISCLGVQGPKGVLYDKQAHFEHRFRMFRRCGSPNVKTFKEFEEDVGELRDVPVMERLRNGISGFKAASGGLDALIKEGKVDGRGWVHEREMGEWMGMKRVCIANCVGVQGVVNGWTEGRTVELGGVEFKYCEEYPVVGIRVRE
jgi:hypothetical protein